MANLIINQLELEAKEHADYFNPRMVVGTKDILAIAKAFRALEQRAEAAEAESKKHHAAWRQAEWVISGEQQNVRVLQGRETALNAEILTLRALIPAKEQEPAAWLVGGWAYENKKNAERRSVYDNLLMEPLFTRPAPAADLADLVPDGWKLVPVEPTEEMIAAGDQFMDGLSRLGDAYDAMLAAAPEVE
ncbi:hypothetical protein WKH53_14560 [Pantoea agglomerans]|uniref:hypothetical protein n=1 Tax=Enterobacter agglomerans TaxID=549 RepID=UPI003C7AA73F